MKRIDYPLYIEHKNQHKIYLRTVGKFCIDIIEKKKNPSKQVIQFLENWIKNHLAIEDLRLVKFKKSFETHQYLN